MVSFGRKMADVQRLLKRVCIIVLKRSVVSFSLAILFSLYNTKDVLDSCFYLLLYFSLTIECRSIR